MNIYNLIILDESGSMSDIERQAVTSMNETIQTVKMAQKKHPEQKQFISIISFSGSGMEGVKVLRDKVPAEEAEEISADDYNPNSCTPLYDAMGFGIISLDKDVSREDTVLVTIITDGMENTSKVFSSRAIAAMVAEHRKMGWTFAYIGANQDSAEVARGMNISNALNFTADEEGTMEMSRRLNRCCARMYDHICAFAETGVDNENFFSEL